MNLLRANCLVLEDGKYVFTQPHQDDFSQCFYLAAVLRMSGSFQDVITRVEPPNYGYALRFDGSNSYVKTDDPGWSTTSKEITLRAWYRPRGFNHDGLLVRCGEDGWWMKLIEGKRLCGGAGGDTFITVDPEDDLTDTNHWYQLVFTVYSPEICYYYLYIDGELKKEVVVPAPGGYYNFSPPYYIGGTPTGDICEGDIDEVGIYYGTWSSPRVLSDYNNGEGVRGTPSDPDLIAGYHFDEGSGNVAMYYDGNQQSIGRLLPESEEPQWIEGHVPDIPVPWKISEYIHSVWHDIHAIQLSGSIVGGSSITIYLNLLGGIVPDTKIFFELLADYQNEIGIIFINGIPAAAFTPSVLGETPEGYVKIGGSWTGKIEMLAIDNKVPNWFNPVDQSTWYHIYWADGSVPIFVYPDNVEQFLHFYDFDKIENSVIPDLGSSPKDFSLYNGSGLEEGLTGYAGKDPYIAHLGIKARVRE